MGKYDDMLKEYRERQNKNEQQQDTQQASGSDPYASMLAEYRASKNATSQPAPNASVHPGGGTALGALTSALSKVAGQSDKYRQGVEQSREKNLSELNALAEAAPYVASAEEGAQNAARRRELTKSLEASDMILGNDPHYYDEATRAAGMLKGWGQRTGGAYLSAGATFGQLAEAQDKTGRILTDSAYSGYMTDPLAIEQMRQAVENGWRPESVGVFKTNKEMLDKADELLGKSEEQMQRVYNGAGKADRILTDVAMGALDLGSDAVLNTIMPGSGLAAMSARSFGQGTYEQRKEGGDLAKQFLGGAKSAAIEILTEKIGGPFENIYGKTLTGRAIKKFVGSFDNPIVKRGLALAASALSEGAEEFLSDVLNPLADRLLKLDDGKGKIFKDGWFEDAMYSALIGSILGLVGESVKVNNGHPMTVEQKEALKGQAIERGIEAIERAAEEQSETPLEGQTEPAIAESPQEAAGEPVPQGGTDTAPTGAETPTAAPALLNSQWRAEGAETPASDTSSALQAPSPQGEGSVDATQQTQTEAETPAPDGEVGEAEEAEPKKPGKQKIVKGGPAEGSYEELGEKYGTIEPGENPERESAVPKQIDERRKTGEAVRTIYEAKATPESRLGDIQQAVVDGKFAHVSVSNEALAKNAESKVKSDGWEKAVRDFAADVRAGKANEKLAAMGAVLLNNAANSGMDGKSYIDLCVDYNTLMHNMGRGLAAARILKTLSPEAKLYALQKTVSKMNEEMSAKAEKKAQKEQKKAERKKKTGADALAEAAEEGKKRKGGRGKAAEKNDADNVPVSMWAERAGEAVADRLQRKLESLGKEKKAKAKTVAQQAEADIKKVLQSYSHTKGKAINAEALENILNNPQFAADLYKSLQNSLQGKAGLSAEEIADLGESWIQKPLADVLAEMSVKKEGIHIRESLVEDFLQAKTDEQRDKVMDSIKQNIADQLPSTLRDRFVALRYLNMLGNFKTQIRNLTGNTTMLATTMVKNHLIRGTFEGIAHALSGGKYEKNTSVLYSPKLYKEAMADFKNVRDEALGEKKYSDIGREYAKDIEEKRRIFKTNTMEAYRKATNWAMEMGDQIFSSAAYADALAGWMQAHKVKSLSSMDAEMLERARAFAIKEAQEATFRDTNGFSSWASRIGRGENTPAAVKAIAEGVIPFRKTPANVLARAFEYSPLGTIGTIYNSIAQGAKGEFSGTDLVNNLSKNFTGTGLAFIGYLLAAGKKLKLRTKDEDDKLEQFHKDQGLQDFSIVLPGGISVTLDWNAPASIPLFMGATLYQVLEDGGISGDDALKIFGQLTEPMMEMSMLSGVNDALELASSYDNSMGALPNLALNALASYLSQGLRNSLLAQGEQAWEKYRRTSYTDKSLPVPSAIQRKTSQLFSGIPGYDFQQQDYIDAWGRKQGQGNTGERILQSFFNPAYVGKNRSTPYDKELERLHKEGFTDVIPQSPARSKAVGGEKLTPEEYTAYATTAGQTKLYLIGDFLDSKEYRKMDDEERAAVIKDLYSYADYKASKRVARMRGDSYENKTWDKRETVFKTGVDPVDYLLGKRKADADGNGSLKQEEIFDWLWNDDTMTEKQKAAAWDANKGNSKTTWEEYKRKHGH